MRVRDLWANVQTPLSLASLLHGRRGSRLSLVAYPGQQHGAYGRARFRPGASGKPVASAVGGGKSPYRLGRDFERATRGRLERRGYFVMRAQGSKGKIDLLAVKALGRDDLLPHPQTHIVLGVQCKRRGDIGSAEWNELFDLCRPYGIVPVVTMKTGERTVGFYRLDERRAPRKPGRPWTEIDPETGEPVPVQLAIA